MASDNRADPGLVEKLVRALLLLEGLVESGLPFVFKGGTSLMLHFDSGKRLSIDIDIIISDSGIELESILENVVAGQGFTRVEVQHRRVESTIKKAHYKLFYEPARRHAPEQEYVLLDILFEDVHYHRLEKRPIASHFAPRIEPDIEVDVPTLEGLLGDKLTAFAPNTTGIPYEKEGRSMSMEIIKQLFDIGCLFDVAEDVAVIKKTFHAFAAAELDYRGDSSLTPNDVIADIFATSLGIVTRGKEGNTIFEEMQDGINRIKSFIYSENYHLDKAITHASKAAYLVTLIEENGDSIKRFDPSIDMSVWKIVEPLTNKLNRLKKSNPEAFYYWYQVFELKSGGPHKQRDYS